MQIKGGRDETGADCEDVPKSLLFVFGQNIDTELSELFWKCTDVSSDLSNRILGLSPFWCRSKLSTHAGEAPHKVPQNAAL